MVPAASGPREAWAWMSLWALEALGLLPAELVGAERPRVTAAGTAAAPARPLRWPVSAAAVSPTVWESGAAQGGDPNGAGVAWEGPGRAAEVRVSSLSGGNTEKGLEKPDKAFLQRLALYL